MGLSIEVPQPRSSFVLAVAAAAAFTVPRALSGRGGDGVAGPPPRVKLKRPLLEEMPDTLKALRRASPSSGGVPAREFLSAAYTLITIFDALPGMGIVKSDLLGNADSLWRLHTPGATLQQMCDAELEALGGGPGCRAAAKEASRRDGSACTSLLWLCRALRFIEALLLELLKPLQASLKECVTAGYAHSLRKHHNALVRGVFAAAVNAAPQRAAFVAAIAPSGASDAEAMRTVSKLLPDFSRPLDALGKYLRDRHLES
mmetsp:Transcript_50926/g.164949  ORF Transcript_50926/g.164949 Transcript_50926/m.164949 type:complete len:259 (-) Transcript_50926:163-939(-)